MKRVICILILILALTFISGVTVYTLINKGTRKEVPTKIIKKISKVTSNVGKTSVQDVYNIYLNDSRHKVKALYNVVFQDKNAEIQLTIYIDGKNIFDEIVSNNVSAKNIDDLFLNENINNYVRLAEKDFSIIKDEKQEFLVINIGYSRDNVLKKYFIYDDMGNVIENEELIVYDSAKSYVNVDNKDLDIFYDGMFLGKIEKNNIYILEYNSEEEKGSILEFKCTMKKGELEKELINTYSGIKLIDKKNINKKNK